MGEDVFKVEVQYKHRDGWHVFSSKDVPGLYVASKDAQAAYDDVEVALKKLIELDWGCDCTVTRARSFDELRHRMAGAGQERASTPQMEAQSYVVMGKRAANDRADHAQRETA